MQMCEKCNCSFLRSTSWFPPLPYQCRNWRQSNLGPLGFPELQRPRGPVEVRGAGEHLRGGVICWCFTRWPDLFPVRPAQSSHYPIFPASSPRLSLLHPPPLSVLSQAAELTPVFSFLLSQPWPETTRNLPKWKVRRQKGSTQPA